MHKHKCDCGYIWRHDSADLKSSIERDRAHQCRRCGAEVRFWYEGPEEPTDDAIPQMIAELQQWTEDLIAEIRGEA